VNALEQRFRELLLVELTELYRQLAVEGSVPPARRCRIEGMANCGLKLSLIGVEALAGLLETVYLQQLGEPLPQRQGITALECIEPSAGQLSLPVRMARAPVFPSTTDTDG